MKWKLNVYFDKPALEVDFVPSVSEINYSIFCSQKVLKLVLKAKNIIMVIIIKMLKINMCLLFNNVFRAAALSSVLVLMNKFVF